MAAAGKLMHAVQYEAYGGGAAALQHVEVPVPSPKKNEVLLKLEAASLNPVDWKIQKGMLRPFLPWKFPLIPGVPIPTKYCLNWNNPKIRMERDRPKYSS